MYIFSIILRLMVFSKVILFLSPKIYDKSSCFLGILYFAYPYFMVYRMHRNIIKLLKREQNGSIIEIWKRSIRLLHRLYVCQSVYKISVFTLLNHAFTSTEMNKNVLFSYDKFAWEQNLNIKWNMNFLINKTWYVSNTKIALSVLNTYLIDRRYLQVCQGQD